MTKIKRSLPFLLIVALAAGAISFFCYKGMTYAQARPGREVHTTQVDDPAWRQPIPLRALVGQSKVIAIGVPVKHVRAFERSESGDHKLSS